MHAQEHHEYAIEAQNLQKTLVAVDARVKRLGQTTPRGGDAHADLSITRALRGEYQTLRWPSDPVYFCRMDWTPDDTNKPETHYIGKIGFEHDGVQVINWAAPFARLMYEGAPGEVEFKVPGGKLKGLLLLKRQMRIAIRTMQDISDEYDLRELPSGTARNAIMDPDDYLKEAIKNRKDAQLQEIVATIQSQQYALIRADADQVLVIQGAAGSGKTSIALHRLAYLLYPGNSSIQAKDCIIFGPNRMFLNYVSAVLPDLGVDAIAQTTLADWMLKELEGLMLGS